MHKIILLIMVLIMNQNKMTKVPMNEVIIEQTKKLIESGTSYDLEALDSIYSPELRIVRLDEKSNITVIDRKDNMAFFRAKKESGEAPLSRMTKFHYAEIKNDRGYVFLTRTMKLNERWEELKYHIEWEMKDGRWRVVHENVYAQPLGSENFE
jgi:hypothetical protein